MIASICDDNRAWLDEAEEMLREYADEHEIALRTACYESPDDLLKDHGEIPDVIFMDIEFENSEDPDSYGIKAAAEINKLFPDCRIVYVTNYLRYAVEAYETEHIWFVTKSRFREYLPEIFSRIIRGKAVSRSEVVVKTIDGTISRIRCRDIIFLERRDRKTRIITPGRTYQVKSRLPEVLDKLPTEKFARCHASFAVNLEKVREIHRDSLILEEGTELVISRGFNKTFRIKYMNMVKNKIVQ